MSSQLHQLHPGSFGPAVVFHYTLITGNYLSSQLCPLALILNAFEIVTAGVGLQSWVDELSIQDAEHPVAEVASLSKDRKKGCLIFIVMNMCSSYC